MSTSISCLSVLEEDCKQVTEVQVQLTQLVGQSAVISSLVV